MSNQLSDIREEEPQLLRLVREEVIGLLFNRHVFRTHQEIVRRNPRLQGRPRSIFSEWAWTVYALANAMGVRRLASDTYQAGDVNLVRLLDMLIRAPVRLWDCFQRCCPDDAARARAGLAVKTEDLVLGWESLACKRLIGVDRKELINAAEKANRFASKRVAHSVPSAEVKTTFSDLDEAIETLKKMAERYTRLLIADLEEQLAQAHRGGLPTIYPWLAQMKERDLLQEMKERKLP